MAAIPARCRGAMVFAWEPEVLAHATHRGNVDLDAGGSRDADAECLRGAIGLSTDHIPEYGRGSSIQPGLRASSMRLWSTLAGRAIAAEHLRDKRDTDIARSRQGP